MKIYTILTLFAILVQSRPVVQTICTLESAPSDLPKVIPSDKDPLEEKVISFSIISLEEISKIQKEFNNLVDAFDDAGIDPTKLYCLEHLDYESVYRLHSTSGLYDKAVIFEEHVKQYSLQDYDFFCYGLMDLLLEEAYSQN